MPAPRYKTAIGACSRTNTRPWERIRRLQIEALPESVPSNELPMKPGETLLPPSKLTTPQQSRRSDGFRPFLRPDSLTSRDRSRPNRASTSEIHWHGQSFAVKTEVDVW